MNEPIEFDSVESVVVTYAKGWYGKSGNIIEDLRHVLSVYSSVDVELITERDVLRVLCSAVSKIHNRWSIQEALVEMVGKKWEGWLDLQRTPEQVMVSQLSFIEPKKNPFDFEKYKDLFPKGHFDKKELDKSDEDVNNGGEYENIEDCKASGLHLTSCDEDGFCNYCGEQE